MLNIERRDYEAPILLELGELREMTQFGDAENSDAAAFPANANPNDAYGPTS